MPQSESKAIIGPAGFTNILAGQRLSISIYQVPLSFVESMPHAAEYIHPGYVDVRITGLESSLIGANSKCYLILTTNEYSNQTEPARGGTSLRWPDTFNLHVNAFSIFRSDCLTPINDCWQLCT
jgi:hypothetical protein